MEQSVNLLCMETDHFANDVYSCLYVRSLHCMRVVYGGMA